MNFRCPNCKRGIAIDEDRWGGKRIRLKCSACGSLHRIQVPSPAAPAPGPTPAGEGITAGPQREEALRIARLILQEIVLYNEKSLEKMTRKREVLTGLRPDLVRAKRHFLSRVSEDLSGREEIFNQMVRDILLTGKE